MCHVVVTDKGDVLYYDPMVQDVSFLLGIGLVWFVGLIFSPLNLFI